MNNLLFVLFLGLNANAMSTLSEVDMQICKLENKKLSEDLNNNLIHESAKSNLPDTSRKNCLNIKATSGESGISSKLVSLRNLNVNGLDFNNDKFSIGYLDYDNSQILLRDKKSNGKVIEWVINMETLLSQKIEVSNE